MKKILTILSAFALLAGGAFAQGEQASKMIRFGLKATPSLNWYKSGDKFTEKNGTVAKFGGGLMVEIRLTDVAVIGTGLQIDLDGGKVKYKNVGDPQTANSTLAEYFYDKQGEEIANYQDAYNAEALSLIQNGQFSDKYDYCVLNERKYSVTYITLPLTLKFRTKEIGSLTYFGQIGVNSSFKYSAKATDEVDKYDLNDLSKRPSTETISKIKIKDMNAINEAAIFGAGAEWNLSGSTSLLFGLNYNFGFTNAAKSESEYIRKVDGTTFSGTTPGTPLKQNLKTNSINLTIGVLF